MVAFEHSKIVDSYQMARGSTTVVVVEAKPWDYKEVRKIMEKDFLLSSLKL